MRWLVIALGLLASAAQGETRNFSLSLAPEIIRSGLDRHILPRFMLKTGRRAVLVETGADISILAGPLAGARAVMQRGNKVFVLLEQGDNPAAARFGDWLLSKIGQNIIQSYQPPTGAPFTPVARQEAAVEITFEGDTDRGAKLSRRHCARCHRVAKGVGLTLGNTPSFMALRALPDWADRMMTYYVRNPHPSFMRIRDFSPAFSKASPPPLKPIILTQNEVEAIQAYVSALEPADLGAPIAQQ